MAHNYFKNQSLPVTGPLVNLAAVTPSDSTDLDYLTRAVFVGTSGNMVVHTADGTSVTLSSLTEGWHPIRVARILATGTTATNIVAGW